MIVERDSGVAWQAKYADGKSFLLVDVQVSHAATATYRTVFSRRTMGVEFQGITKSLQRMHTHAAEPNLVDASLPDLPHNLDA